MALQKHLLSFVVILLSSLSCYTTVHGDPPHNYDRAYPLFFGPIDDGTFENSINLEHTNFRLKKVDEVRSLRASVKTVSVDDFGAKGDGKTDDTEAFKKAWEVACSSSTIAVFVVPENKNYLVKPVTFSGPCNSVLTMQVYGIIKASDYQSDYNEDGRHWLLFDNVQNLMVEGGGIINGNGDIWWKNSCKINKELPCKIAPTALTFYNCKNLTLKNLKIQDAQQIHVSFEKCVNVGAFSLTVTAPKGSPNTDGIHVANTLNIHIKRCVIGTGDDCISIVDGSKLVNVTDITCGPGHGISSIGIGSLGAGGSEAYVSDVTVNGANLTGTTNGVRIKTWQEGSGRARNIKFQNIQMNSVYNPIIINQNYCDPCKDRRTVVEVKDVVYQNIKGTSASEVAITFNCCSSVPCQGILLQNVNIKGDKGETTKAICNNVNFNDIGVVSPKCP